MLRRTKQSHPRIRAIAMAVPAAAATITGGTSAQAAERLPVATKAFCVDRLSPDGANYLVMEEAWGKGLLGCGARSGRLGR
jgi:hypothetical protein